MKKEDINIGDVYAVRIGSAVENSAVRIDGWLDGAHHRKGKFYGTNLRTGKRITGTAARLRYRMRYVEQSGRWVQDVNKPPVD